MSLLLDTHYVFALAGSPGRLSAEEIRFLRTPTRRFIVSAVSVWEIRLKWNAFDRSGGRKGPLDPNDVVRLLARQPVDFLNLEPTHAAVELRTAISHHDPFDELLLAQAQVEDLKLFSRDTKLIGHPLVTSLA